jgi:hypothetical protein
MTKHNKVLNVCDNGEYLTVQFEREDGQIAIGVYKRFGWDRPPTEERAKFEKIIGSPPRRVIGRLKGPIPPTQ